MGEACGKSDLSHGLWSGDVLVYDVLWILPLSTSPLLQKLWKISARVKPTLDYRRVLLLLVDEFEVYSDTGKSDEPATADYKVSFRRGTIRPGFSAFLKSVQDGYPLSFIVQILSSISQTVCWPLTSPERD
jgi:hypothetical protein